VSRSSWWYGASTTYSCQLACKSRQLRTAIIMGLHSTHHHSRVLYLHQIQHNLNNSRVPVCSLHVAFGLITEWILVAVTSLLTNRPTAASSLLAIHRSAIVTFEIFLLHCRFCRRRLHGRSHLMCIHARVGRERLLKGKKKSEQDYQPKQLFEKRTNKIEKDKRPIVRKAAAQESFPVPVLWVVLTSHIHGSAHGICAPHAKLSHNKQRSDFQTFPFARIA
jgi:hypothetical protein